MTPDRRRQGRAIRKQRREIQAALAAFSTIDWDLLFDSLARAFGEVAVAAIQVGEFLSTLLTPEFVATYEAHKRKVERAESLVNQDC